LDAIKRQATARLAGDSLSGHDGDDFSTPSAMLGQYSQQ
jgi:hypothetical protein